jgi:DNA-binding response OmpR family regulator
VLIVDDNDDIVLTLAMLLQDEGYEVRGVGHARDAIVEVAEFDPDAVIADIGLPDMSGWDLARAVRMVSERADRPLMIAISGEFTKGADAVLTQMAGFNHFLAKPFDPAVIIRILPDLSA